MTDHRLRGLHRLFLSNIFNVNVMKQITRIVCIVSLAPTIRMGYKRSAYNNLWNQCYRVD